MVISRAVLSNSDQITFEFIFNFTHAQLILLQGVTSVFTVPKPASAAEPEGRRIASINGKASLDVDAQFYPYRGRTRPVF